jgi:MerR family transcriptional regulator, Zn(II)-responsive regulator of zntA
VGSLIERTRALLKVKGRSRTRRNTSSERPKPSAASKSPAKAARAATGRVKIGAAAAKLGTTTRTLTFYEEEGLIQPKRTPKGTRLYSEDDIKRASIVLRLSQIGIGMQRIKEIALTRPTYNSGKEASRKMVPLLEALERELGERVAQLVSLRKDVRRGTELIRSCWYCTRKPSRATCPQCPVEARLDDSLTARLVWDPDRGD